jgi:hypothetical protein
VVVSVAGVSENGGPIESGYAQFDTHPMPPPPDGNLLSPENGAHEDCRRLDVVNQQIKAFLKPNGSVQQFCLGTCDPE